MSFRPFNVRAICWQCVTAALKPFELRLISEMAFVDARNLMAEKTGWSCRVRYLTANLLIAISFVALSNLATVCGRWYSGADAGHSNCNETRSLSDATITAAPFTYLVVQCSPLHLCCLELHMIEFIELSSWPLKRSIDNVSSASFAS